MPAVQCRSSHTTQPVRIPSQVCLSDGPNSRDRNLMPTKCFICTEQIPQIQTQRVSRLDQLARVTDAFRCSFTPESKVTPLRP